MGVAMRSGVVAASITRRGNDNPVRLDLRDRRFGGERGEDASHGGAHHCLCIFPLAWHGVRAVPVFFRDLAERDARYVVCSPSSAPMAPNLLTVTRTRNVLGGVLEFHL